MLEPELSGNSTVSVSKDQVSVDIKEEAVIMHVKSGIYFGLDTVGASIWKLIQEPKTVNEIQDAIIEEFNVDPERCERDTLSFIKELYREGLIEVRGETSS